MPPRNFLGRSWTCLIVLLLIGVYGCDEQCYKPRVETATFQMDENNAIADGVCYSTCILTISIDVSDLSSSSCNDKQKLKGCVAGCSSQKNSISLSECQLKCSSCINETETIPMECDSCDFTACMVGCNLTVHLNRLAISLGNANVTLLPVPEKLYFYKANIQINDDIMQSAAITREQSGTCEKA
ncbi:uncharacterized protein [Dysidea avara]|uniref:uncharacterized protein n=1 Tax=Dysidea avara TaxID=196820 RepID=UPI003316E4BB